MSQSNQGYPTIQHKCDSTHFLSPEEVVVKENRACPRRKSSNSPITRRILFSKDQTETSSFHFLDES